MINDKTISPKKNKTIAFVFPSLMASFKNEILMGMAHYAQKRRNISIKCIEDYHVE